MKTTIEQSLDAIQSPKIRAIVAKSALSFINLMAHKESEIIETMQEIEEGKKLSISHSLVLDLEKNNQMDRVSFSVRHQIECDGEIPNPDQPELPISGEEGA
jgi:hypothetical protein